jgi:acetylglutamate synthase
MALNVNRLKGLIKEAFQDEQTEEEDHNASLDRISGKLAQAIIAEIKQATIQYQTGLVAPNGAVTGIITHTIT